MKTQDKMTRWAKSQPSLRMADGGQTAFNADALQGASMVQHYSPMMAMPAGLAMADGGLVSGPKPNPLTPDKPQTPIPNWMRYSLREGREVPGEGQGDKIPAMLEPDEFVVSNSMMKRKPGLRDALHDIRDETLEAEGKDPRAVDAKQVRGMMADTGGHHEVSDKRTGLDEPLVRQGVRADADRVPGSQGGRLRLVDGGFPGIEFNNAAWREAQHSRNVNPPLDPSKPAFHGDGRYGAPPNPAQVSAPPEAAPGRFQGVRNFVGGGAPEGVGGAFKNLASAGTDALRTVGNVGASALRVAGKVAPFAAAGSATYQGLNTETEDYAKRFGLEGTQPGVMRDLGVRALGVASDIGNDMTFGQAKKYLYRDGETGGLGAKGPLPPTAAARPSIRNGADVPAPGSNQGAYDTANADFSRYAQRQGAGAAAGSEEGVVKRVGNSFSGTNVSGYGNQNVVPGMDPGLIAETLRNPDGSKWGAADNARMAQNIRDGVDPKAGTSGQVRNPIAEFEANAPKRGEFGYRQAQNDLARMRAEAVQTRGQDITSADSRYGHELTASNNRARLRYDMGKDQRGYDFEREKFDEEKSKTNFDARQKAQKDTTDEIASYLPPGPDGKPDMAAAANHMGALNAHVSSRMEQLQQHLQLNPGDKTAASELQGLQSRGVAQLSSKAKRDFLVGKRAGDVARDTATGSLTPWGTAAVEDDAPIKSLRKQKTLFGHDYISDRGDVIPGRYIDKTDATFGIGGRPNRNYDSLKLRE